MNRVIAPTRILITILANLIDNIPVMGPVIFHKKLTIKIFDI